MKSIDYLIIAVLGGLGSITGTIIAAVVLGIINMFLQKRFKPSYDYLRLGFDSCNALPSRWTSWNKRTLSLKILQ